MWIWDYKIRKNWKPKTGKEWEWFLVRKVNYGDFKGLNKRVFVKFFKKIKNRLDVGKREMLADYLRNV
ncbi:hypothetical protein A2982_02355 [candidate division WWE3 bacterium RIFCSPLOWO2_01_FULL_39_13]|uniref:Uncharacterized protein n=1 Tax=candidate division WWE3 bacterium RIFCSPLOWO2_01_FULL_39_13 TaxID=1802624 RepID=A0A1F4V1M9_UNCKA|nr:MAG: hypothetical protein A2982_02355 [candidate division WWE3 bacterium RIFCSPLOWO2_01_FULL_39_13]